MGCCDVTECCTEGIRITGNALIPLGERVLDRGHDPLVWPGSKAWASGVLPPPRLRFGGIGGGGADRPLEAPVTGGRFRWWNFFLY